jgi:hypothetical protein
MRPCADSTRTWRFVVSAFVVPPDHPEGLAPEGDDEAEARAP